MAPDAEQVARQVAQALNEDAAVQDCTAALLDPNLSARGEICCREVAVLCGAAWVDETYRQLNPKVQLDWQHPDGGELKANQVVCTLQGPAVALVQGERVALNFLQLLSATATRTRRLVQQLDNSTPAVLDTRKTLPGLRQAQKYAVTCGGGMPHRASLEEAVLIKENHWALLDDLAAAVATARSGGQPIMIEVETLEQLEQTRKLQPDVILLDNMTPDQVRQAVAACPDIPLEISGGLNESNVTDYAATGAARMSLGTLTKDVQAVDFSMRVLRD